MSNLNTLVNEVATIKNDILTCHENLKNKLIAMGIDVDNKKLGELIESVDADSFSKIPKWMIGTWYQRMELVTVRYDHTSVVIDQDIYTMGGYKGSVIKSVEKTNVADNTRTTLSDMPTALRYHTAAAVGKYIYVMGGSTNDGTVQTNYCYDVDNDSWTEKTSVPYYIRTATAVSAGNNIYLMGGISSTDTINLNYRYDVVLDEWFPMESMPYGVTDHTAVVKGKYIYVLGGCDNNGDNVNYNLRYDTTTNQWIELEPIPTTLRRHSAAVCGNYIYLYGGRAGTTDKNNSVFYRYSITSDEWTTIIGSGSPGSVELHTAVVIDKGMYIIGGYTTTASGLVYCCICE